jgi:hypothetical protein
MDLRVFTTTTATTPYDHDEERPTLVYVDDDSYEQRLNHPPRPEASTSTNTNMASTSGYTNHSATMSHNEMVTEDDIRAGSTHANVTHGTAAAGNLQSNGDHSHLLASSHHQQYQHHLPPFLHHNLHHLSRSESPYPHNHSLATSARTSMTRVDLDDQVASQARHVDSHEHDHERDMTRDGGDGLQPMVHDDRGGHHGEGDGVAESVPGPVLGGSAALETGQGQGSSYPATSSTMPAMEASSSSSPMAAASYPSSSSPLYPPTTSTSDAHTSSSPSTQAQPLSSPQSPSNAQPDPPPSQSSPSNEPSQAPAPPQTPKVFLTFLLLSGQRRLMSFEPDTTVGRVKELVWNGWTSNWQGDARPHAPSYIRMIYQGKILQDDDTLLRTLILLFLISTQSHIVPSLSRSEPPNPPLLTRTD